MIKKYLKTAIVMTCVSVVIASSLFYLNGNSVKTDSVKVQNAIDEDQAKSNGIDVESPHSQIAQPYARTPFLGLKDPRWIKWEELSERDPSFQWKTPIQFYGRVLDEQDQPVSDAKVEYFWNGIEEKYGDDGVGRETMRSDSQGMFTIKGIHGKVLKLLVRKDGYYSHRPLTDGLFEYAAF